MRRKPIHVWYEGDTALWTADGLMFDGIVVTGLKNAIGRQALVHVPRQALPELIERAACAAGTDDLHSYSDKRGDGDFGKYHIGFRGRVIDYRIGAIRFLDQLASDLEAEVVAQGGVLPAPDEPFPRVPYQPADNEGLERHRAETVAHWEAALNQARAIRHLDESR